MLRFIRLSLTVAAAIMAVVVLVLVIGVRHTPAPAGGAALAPAPLAAGDPVERTAPPLRLVDEHGHILSLSSLRGRWLVIAPSMTLCHEVCPMTTGALMQVQSRLRAAGLASQVTLAEVSVDPWRDTPARLRAYRRLTGADFALLTGSHAQLQRFWRFFGVYFKRVPQGKPPDVDWLTHRPESFDVEHSDGLFFLDPSGRERIAVVGQPDVGGRLSHTLRALLNAEGRANLAHPQLPWTAGQVMDDLDWLMGREVPGSTLAPVRAPSRAVATGMLSGSPAPLAGVHSQAGELLGGAGALRERIARLRGYPIVVNAWASWCPPCRGEFPLFAGAAASYGRRVAFLGFNAEDSPGAARAFLATHPVSYPSYQGSTASIGSLASLVGLPTTVFIDARGRVVFVHPGQYETQATLDQDVERYALGQAAD
ncbi:MAG: SCO family protein [Solirubrobacterales bacterium]|nr:SCO family protein [Solirubrobacterales bacterium]